MTEQDPLTRLDDVLDPLLPAGPPPVAGLVARGRRVRRRRAGVRAGLAAAVAVVAVSTVPVLAGEGDPWAGPTAPANTAAVDPGWKSIGLNGVVVSVPEDWAPRSCGRGGIAFGPVLGTPRGGRECVVGGVVELRSVVFADMAWPTEPLNGLEVLRDERTCDDTPDSPAAPCSWETQTRVSVPDRAVELVITSSGEAASEIEEQIADSLRPMPGGRTSVPPLDETPRLSEACRALTGAGLRATSDDARVDIDPCLVFGNFNIAGLRPEPGSIVTLGSPVAVVTGQDERRVGYGGVSVVPPTGWLPSPGCARSPGLRVGRTCDGPGIAFLPAVLSAGPRDDRRTVNGLQVAVHYGCPPNAGCLPPERPSAYVIVTALDLQVSISAPTRDGIDQIIASLAPIPDGFVAVPGVGYGVDDAEAVLALENAGLVADLPEVNFPHYVTGTEPAAGSIVAEGSTVRVSVGDG